MHNTQTKKNVPELRFPEFDGEWEEKKLSDLGSFLKTYSFSRSKEGIGKFKHIHYGDIHSKFPSILDNTKTVPTISGFESKLKEFTVVKKGDLIFADASEDYTDLGKAIMVNFSDENVLSGLHTHLFRMKQDVVSRYLIYLTKTEEYRRHIAKEGNGISVLGISKINLGKFRLLLPSINEQEKIGTFFSKLDQQIELAEKKVSLLHEQKKGYMQKIFSQELRFKDENGNDYPEWEEKKLGDLIKINSGHSPSTFEIGKGHPYVKVNDLNNNSKYQRISEYEVIPVQDTIPPNSIIFPKRGAAILLNKLRINKVECYIDTNLMALSGYEEYEFLFYSLFKEGLYRIADTSTIPQINNKHITPYKINLPKKKEQQKIGSFFSKLDQRIELAEQKVEQLKEQKRGLLQKMFV